MHWHSNLVFIAAVSLLGAGHSQTTSTPEPRLPRNPPVTAAAPEPRLPRPGPVVLPGTGTAPEGMPTAPFRCAAGAITCVEVVSTSASTQPSVPLTWGQVFKAGDWKHAAQRLTAQVDNTPIPLQTDELSSHRDGSARFAVLSAQLAPLAPGQRRIIHLYAAPQASHSAPMPLPAEPDWNLEIEVKVYDAERRVISTLIALPQEQLKTQIARNAKPRLQGPVALEYTLLAPLKDTSTGQAHPHLSARLHTRLYDEGQRIRTDVVMENTRTWTPQPANITYGLTIRRHGMVLHEQPPFTHHHHARWHTVVWSGGAAPAHRIRHDMPYFMASRATWNYDLSLAVPDQVLAKKFALLKSKRQDQEALGPMGNVFLMPAFGTTGARADIGPLPEWTVYYLLSQDERAKEIMLANADAAGSVPIHYRDEATGQPLDVEKNPTVTLAYGTSRPLLPAVTDRTLWSPDVAHQASFSYIPYLMTGDSFYLDETVFWAAWNIASINPDYRNNAAGLIRSSQVRGQAWALRSIGEAFRALPDSHPMKKYFEERLANNLHSFAKNNDESPMGIIHHHGDINRIHPWQNDYVSIVLSLLAENGDPQALEALKRVSQFTVGRFLNEANGFCVAKAPGGGWIYRDTEGKYISNWKALFDRNYPSDADTPCSALTVTEGYPRRGIGYAASARAMLAAASNAGIPGARSAYLQWKEMTPDMDAKLPSAPTWAIIPRP